MIQYFFFFFWQQEESLYGILGHFPFTSVICMIVSLDKWNSFWHSPVRGYINNASFILILLFFFFGQRSFIFFFSEFDFIAFICM